MPAPVRSRVIVIAGPSGSGKTRLCRRLGLPVLSLDDYYKDGDDPSLPTVDLAGGAPIVDWDSPGSWRLCDSLAAIETLCREGAVDVPAYDISQSRRTGRHRLELAGSAYFVAEGIFAQEVVAQCRERGLLAAAICLTQHPVVTFLRRLSRDLREHRKPPGVLVRRGLRLLREQRRVVAHAEALGCVVLHPDAAYTWIQGLVASAPDRPAR
ncbi:uridine kinase [Marmoricola sp. URHA0025 HA25]